MPRKQVSNKWYASNNKRINEVILTNYDELIDFNGEKHFYAKTPLLSVSSVLRPIFDIKLATIPSMTLETTRLEGQDLMRQLEHLWKSKNSNIAQYDYMSERVRLMFYALVQCLSENRFKIKYVEKHVTDGKWHGYIDLIVREKANLNNALVEIKTRSDENDLRDTDIAQIQAYANMIGARSCRKYVIIISRKSFKAKLYKVGYHEGARRLKVINNYLETFGLEKYKFDLK